MDDPDKMYGKRVERFTRRTPGTCSSTSLIEGGNPSDRDGKIVPGIFSGESLVMDRSLTVLKESPWRDTD